MAQINKLSLALSGALVLAIAGGYYLGHRGEEPAAPPPVPGAPGVSGTAPGADSPTPTPIVLSNPDLRKAIELVKKEDWDAARKALEAIPAGDDAYPTALHNLGLIYEKLGALETSRDAFRKLTTLQPENPEAWVGLGWIDYRMGELGGAELATLRAIEVLPEHLNARYNLGLFRIARGHIDDAVTTYLRAFRMDRQHQALVNALKDVRAYAEEHPDEGAPHYALALFFHTLDESGHETLELEAYLASKPERDLEERARKRLESARAKALKEGLLPRPASSPSGSATPSPRARTP